MILAALLFEFYGCRRCRERVPVEAALDIDDHVGEGSLISGHYFLADRRCRLRPLEQAGSAAMLMAFILGAAPSS